MRIGEVTGSYGIYPLMTRVSVGDRPVNAVVSSPELGDVTEEDAMQPYIIPIYGRNGIANDAEAASRRREPGQKGLSVYA